MRRLAFAVAFLLALTIPALADHVNLGLLSYDVLIAAGTGPGVNVFNIVNFTGDPGSAGFALPPDFPIFTFLTLKDTSLSLVVDGTPQVIVLGDITPGAFPALGALQFPDTALITSAILTATLSSTSLVLADSSVFLADGSVSLNLLPSIGPALVAGTDLGIITADSPSSATPEPGGLVVVAGLLGMLAAQFARAKKRNS